MKTTIRSIIPLAVLLAITSPVTAQTGTPMPERENEVSHAVEVLGCLDKQAGKFQLTFDDGIYDLAGNIAGLEKHIGDEMEISGTVLEHPMTVKEAYSIPEATLHVTRIKTILHRSPAGVPPVLGSIDVWKSLTNQPYGVRLRVPGTFGLAVNDVDPLEFNFVGPQGAPTTLFQTQHIAKEAYPDSNFVDGSFTAVVDPSISNEIACLQFKTFWPPHTSMLILQGVKYSHTLNVSVGGGSYSDDYSFHTFQHGLCYEFQFNLYQGNTRALAVPCSVLALSEHNKFQLIKAVLSKITFLKPE